MRGDLDKYPEVSFIGGMMFSDFLDEMIKHYESKYAEITGKEISLAPASPERLRLYSAAVMIYQGFQYLDRSGKNGLLKYSTGDFLDNLAALKRVARNPAVAAVTKLKFTLSKPQGFAITVPAGTRAKVDELFFATTKTVEISSGEQSIEVAAVCLTPGTVGNGYAEGRIQILVDPVNYVKAVVNTTETSGGIDAESDDELAQRVYLAPSGYSTAGPEDAYRYLVMTHNQGIEDCFIVSEQPGEVDIYIMMQGGETPGPEEIENLQNYLEDGNRKPLTDRVMVKAPELKEYEIDATYYIAESDRENVEVIKKQVESACQEYQKWQAAVIGRDVNPSQLTYMLIGAGACYVVIRSPVFEEITEAAISKARSVNLEYGGLKDARTL